MIPRPLPLFLPHPVEYSARIQRTYQSHIVRKTRAVLQLLCQIQSVLLLQHAFGRKGLSASVAWVAVVTNNLPFWAYSCMELLSDIA